MKKRYHVNADSWLYGKLHRKGSYIELTPKQAKYELLAGTITAERTSVSVEVSPGTKHVVEVAVPPVMTRAVAMKRVEAADKDNAKAAVVLEPIAKVPDKTEKFVVSTKRGKADIVVAVDGAYKKELEKYGVDVGAMLSEAIKKADPYLPVEAAKPVKKSESKKDADE